MMLMIVRCGETDSYGDGDGGTRRPTGVCQTSWSSVRRKVKTTFRSAGQRCPIPPFYRYRSQVSLLHAVTSFYRIISRYRVQQ